MVPADDLPVAVDQASDDGTSEAENSNLPALLTEEADLGDQNQEAEEDVSYLDAE